MNSPRLGMKPKELMNVLQPKPRYIQMTMCHNRFKLIANLSRESISIDDKVSVVIVDIGGSEMAQHRVDDVGWTLDTIALSMTASTKSK